MSSSIDPPWLAHNATASFHNIRDLILNISSINFTGNGTAIMHHSVVEEDDIWSVFLACIVLNWTV